MNSVLMHMADGLISVNIGVIFMIISFIMIGFSIKKINQEHDDRKIPLMGVMGAFVFAAQMINFTIPGTGSSGHIGGGILLCLILGQYPAFLSLCSVLIIQCLFFGDGGLLALGCNIFNMGILPCFVAYPLIVKPLLKKNLTSSRVLLTSILGVVVGLEMGAFAVVLQTLVSNITELPFISFVVLMLPIHLAIGLVEGLITSAVVLYVLKDKREIVDHALNDKHFGTLNIKRQVAVFVVLTILVGGGLSLYASSNPDGLEWSIEGITGTDEIEASGSTKDTLAKVQSSTSFLPDYNFSGSDSKLGVSVSGIIGGAATLILIGGIGYIVVKKKNMNKLKGSLLKFGYIEKLANGDSLIHRLNPLLKIILALMYIIFVISTNYLDFFELLLYLIIIGIMILLSKVSFMDLFKRSLIGLPISLCIGFSNLLFSTTIINFYGVNISTGVLLFITIIIKNILCLMAVFLLMATTKFDSITCELVHLKIPSIFVLQLVMIYRYIFVLVEEALTMIQAYQLKNPQSKGIAFKDMGSFVGSLLVRSFERSNEVYNAMKCRGFDVKQGYLNYVDFEIENYFLLMMAVGVLMMVKVVF